MFTQGIHGLCIQEVRTDLTTDGLIQKLAIYFPTDQWKYGYSKGSKPAGTPGQGLLTLIHKIDDGNYEIDIKFAENRAKTLAWHEIDLGFENQKFKLTHFYANPRNSKLDESFKTLLNNSDNSVGDLNKTLSSYPIRNADYLNTLSQFDLVELITQKTRIPKTVKGATDPTTDPDSVMSHCRHNESVRFIERDVLKSDHLAYVLETDFYWPSWKPIPPKYGNYMDYSMLTMEMCEESWDKCPGFPGKDEISEVFARDFEQISKYGRISGKSPSLPPEFADKTTDEIWEERIVSSNKMLHLGEIFVLEKQIRKLRDSLECENQPKLSSKKRKKHYGDFHKKVSKAKRVSRDKYDRYKRCVRKAERLRKKGKRFTVLELNRELEKLKDSAPGVDKVVKMMLPRKVSNQNKLLHFFNKSIFEDANFHPKLNRTKLQFIPKSESEKLRPLGIGLRVSALMDRLAAIRFDPLIRADKTYDESYGFISGLSTEEFFGRMLGIVEEKKLNGSYVGMTQMDVEGAYTSVPHIEMILALEDFVNRTDDPDSHQYLIHFVVKWLENRVVMFEKTSLLMKCGLVQGSPVSPPIFVIFLSYKSDSNNSIILIYADDVQLISWGPTPKDLRDEVEKEVKKFEKWLNERDMCFAPKKSKFMLLNRTKQTADKHFADFCIEVVGGARVLGVWVESNLCFRKHVQNVANKLRKRINALRLFKKIGLSINHALQFSTCVANGATYGLWWHAYLSTTDWNQLERIWSRFLKVSTHEHCPKAAKPDKVRELLGVRDFRSFSDYLVHLRTANHHLKPRCARFTLSPQELQTHRERSTTTIPTKSRPCTQRQSLKHVREEEERRASRKLGTVKSYTIELAERHGWNAESFVKTKEELRKKYEIDRKKAKPELNLPKHELQNYLKSLCNPKVFQQITS